jgi:N-acetylmuramoyl-L-alanine amidase
MSKIVYLSPSTQEKNVGYGGYGTEEKRMNEIADVVEKTLKEFEITVYRNTPSMAVKEFVKDSNSKKPDVHVAIHSNACNGSARGCVAFCHKFGGNGEKLTKAIYDELEPLTPTSDRGVKEGYNLYGEGKPLYETAYTSAPATLVEVAFHDNREDAQWIISNIANIGTAIAKGILKYLGIEYKPEMTYEQAFKIITSVIDTPYSFWLKKKGIDTSFPELVIKFAQYVEEVKENG